MSRTRIFISSTFFDLAQVRDDIRTTITGIGHEPVLNEYPSFPVTPSLDTIENCKRAVRDTGIFVLIIGGRRGSLDSATGKSITSIEYETAVQSGIDCFIFVHEQVMNALPLWQKNPDADFTTLVDSAQVFEFIGGITSAQQWVFRFQRASDISEILRNQLSVFLKDLIDRKRGGKLDPIPEFAAESLRARQLALDRPRLWEYRLTEELLRSKLDSLRQDYKDFENGMLFKPRRPMDGREYIDSIQARLSELTKIVDVIKFTMENDLMAACGKPGEAGDGKAILRAANKMVDACRRLLDWELDIDSWVAPPKLNRVGESLRGFSLSVLIELEKIPQQIAKALEGERTGTRNFNITLTLTSPPQLGAFRIAIGELLQNPSWWKP